MGPSVHNQRIERLWRDVYTGCNSLFYHLFHYLEDTALLDPNNDIHLYALHYVYIPRINEALSLFVCAWNRHQLRTAGSFSPQQLWVSGMLQYMHSQHSAVHDYFEAQQEEYGIDWNGPIPDIETDHTVIVEDVSNVLNAAQSQHLSLYVDPLQESSVWGIDLYLQAVQIIEYLLHNP